MPSVCEDAAWSPAGHWNVSTRTTSTASTRLSWRLIVSILGLTIVDGVLTVELVGSHCEEVNPVMKYMLNRGYGMFFITKYILTALGLPFLLIFKNHLLFGTRFRVGYVFPVILMLYLALIAYQLVLL